jgi:sec-independent protein translocase protein TatA
MFGIGGLEVLVILVVTLLLFGAKRLPELTRSLGRSLNEFKRGMNTTLSELDWEEEQTTSEKKESPKTVNSENQ